MDYSDCGLLDQHCSCLPSHSSATTTLRSSSGTPMIGGPRVRYSFHNSVPTLVASPGQTKPPNRVADRRSRTHSINVGMRCRSSDSSTLNTMTYRIASSTLFIAPLLQVSPLGRH